MKRVLLSFACVMIFALSACGGGDDNSSGRKKPTPTPTATPTATATPSAAQRSGATAVFRAAGVP